MWGWGGEGPWSLAGPEQRLSTAGRAALETRSSAPGRTRRRQVSWNPSLSWASECLSPREGQCGFVFPWVHLALCPLSPCRGPPASPTGNLKA